MLLLAYSQPVCPICSLEIRLMRAIDSSTGGHGVRCEMS